MRTRLFVDFWNFQINWNSRSKKHIDWQKVPHVLLGEAQRIISNGGLTGKLAFEEIRVYSSFEPAKGNDRKLKGWLQSWLDRQPGFTVSIRERKSRQKPIRCRECGHEVAQCCKCQKPYSHAAEKGVDTAICTDLLSLAWEGAYDLAILLSSDADYIPAVERLQTKKFKIINATWHGHGHDLAKTCWAHFEIDSLIPHLERPPQS